MCVVGDRRSRLRLENHKVGQKVFRLNENIVNNLLSDGFCHLPIEEKNQMFYTGIVWGSLAQ